MKKVELLSPCGNMESMNQAIHNGADAVYLGGKKFGARAYANNFDNDEMIKAIKYCHLYDVKIYVTVNTIIYEEEFEEALKYIEFLYINKVDAIIMQDIGLIKKSKEMYPNLEIHASTQSHNQNSEGIKLLKALGVTRVVLARELSLEEIKEIDENIEKEVFIHGALCISYSGCCLMSSMNGNRSGNRGECTGCCRLPYELYCEDNHIETNGKYLLSTRELNTSKNIKELIESNVCSLKIEGRMKSPEYVGFVTRVYRNLLDKYYNNEEVQVSDEDLNKLKKLYNRKFTEGFIFNDNNNIMNIETSNHIGVEIGRVIDVDKNKIKISLTDTLNQEDGIRFGNEKGMTVNKLYDENNLLVNSVPKGNIAILDNKIGLDKRLPVLKTIDYKLITELKNYKEKKIPVDISFRGIIDEHITISISDGKNNITVNGPICVKSINAPITKERLEEQLNRLNDTPLIINKMDINISDNIFIVIKDINDLRRRVIEGLIEKRENPNRDIIINKDKLIINRDSNNKTKISILVRTKDQLMCAIDKRIDNIYVTDYSLYNEYKDKENIFYKIPRIIRNYMDYKNNNLLVTELGGVNKYSKENKVVGDYSLNIANSYGVNYLIDEHKLSLVTLSPECSNETIRQIAASSSNLEIIVYGKLELMVMKYCPLKMLINKNNNTCNICKSNKKYYLKDENDNKYPILNNNETTYIMSNRIIDKTKYIKDYIKMNIESFRIELLDEDYNETEKIINKIIGEMNGYCNN